MKILVQRVSVCYEPYYCNCMQCGSPIWTEAERHRGTCAKEAAVADWLKAQVAGKMGRRLKPLTKAEIEERVDAIVARDRARAG